MRIFIKAKPKSAKEYVKKIDTLHFTVAVKEPPVKGKANDAIIKALADYFHIKTSQVIFVSGETSRQKVFEVPFDFEELEVFGEKNVQKKMFLD